MKKYLLVFMALFLTAAVVMATVVNSSKKKATPKTKKERCEKKSQCRRLSNVACY